MKKQIAVYGSTGSIGKQTLEVIAHYPSDLEVSVLVAKNNYLLLIEQAIRHQPNIVVIANETHYQSVKEALKNYPIKVFAGSNAMTEVAEMNVYDTLLAAIVGFDGMPSTLKALENGKTVALANKESMVVAGHLMTETAKKTKAKIIPVDSELVAIDQCVESGMKNEIARVILTASGGAFRTKSKEDVIQLNAQDALKHPTWKMGNKITIDSATLMNKGFEMMEAKWFFQLNTEQITALIHPQSIIHSLVEFHDGQMIAQLAMPDMRIPIAYALFYPFRKIAHWSKLDLLKMQPLSFEEIDENKFPAITLAKYAMKQGGNIPCALNASNEVMVKAFIENRVSFYEMTNIMEKVLHQTKLISNPTLEDHFNCDKAIREETEKLIYMK